MRTAMGLTIMLSTFCLGNAQAGYYLAPSSPIANGRWGNQAPNVHASYISDATWSVDVYVPKNQGTVKAVKWRTYTHPYYDDGFYGYVRYVGDLDCGDVDGGAVVVIDVRDGSGANVGVMSYAHLDNVQVSEGDTFPWYSYPLLGYTRRWDNSSCWNITSDNATHVHMEWGHDAPYSSNHYGYSSGATIGFTMGTIHNW